MGGGSPYAMESDRQTQRQRTKAVSQSERQAVDTEVNRSLQSNKRIQSSGASTQEINKTTRPAYRFVFRAAIVLNFNLRVEIQSFDWIDPFDGSHRIALAKPAHNF
jgi:hypothetical protein